jgi:hypothetical protein
VKAVIQSEGCARVRIFNILVYRGRNDVRIMARPSNKDIL